VNPDSAQRTIAYLANTFPSAVEPYVLDEIRELHERGVKVVACSVWAPKDIPPPDMDKVARRIVIFRPSSLGVLPSAICLLWHRRKPVLEILRRAASDPEQSWARRCKLVIHTFLGACLAVQISKHRVRHIHVHHGYFGAWLATIASTLLKIPYTMTLHGSDLLLHRAFLGIKLEKSVGAFTVSEYNRQVLRGRYPESAHKIMLRRLGTQIPEPLITRTRAPHDPFVIATAGRLHAVKNHGFLVKACALLTARGAPIICRIAGDGPQREKLNGQIRRLALGREIQLLGHLGQAELNRLFTTADLFVLTSRSEGIPVVLMEAMAHGVVVLAPDITGIPELVVDGQTGFLYEAGSIDDFVARVELIRYAFSALDPVRQAARRHVETYFHHRTNLNLFVTELLRIIESAAEVPDEDPVLQQI
jgi:glycosyltransferase involved in cell wall biosynthesis